MKVSDGTFDLIGWHFKPLMNSPWRWIDKVRLQYWPVCAPNTSPARVLWAPRLATDDEEAVTVVAEGAFFDPKVSDVGCKSDLVTIEKCVCFILGKPMIPWLRHKMRHESVRWDLWPHRMAFLTANELTVEVNWQGKIAILTVLCTKYKPCYSLVSTTVGDRWRRSRHGSRWRCNFGPESLRFWVQK